MNSLYAYFGLVDLHKVDMPGHSLYQLGLIDSLSETYGDEKFDFFSYLPDDILNENTDTSSHFPSDNLGKVFQEYYQKLISENYCPDLNEVLNKIAKKEYKKLWLKARFRNLSTLTKKWKDTLAFEKIVTAAIAAGYNANEIIILDTDLSLPGKFVQKYQGKLTFRIPSIDFKGISNRFLNDCIKVHKEDYLKYASIVFYGNIDTSNYKSGNEKSEILEECIKVLQSEYMDNEKGDESVILIHKASSGLLSNPVTSHIYRDNRPEIWDALITSSIMLNVTKDKYNTQKFIPARIYEALIFGMIPVSYTFEWLSKTFSFNNTEDLLEIVKYLRELDHSEDIKSAYLHFVNDYRNHLKSCDEPIQITEEDIYQSSR